MKDLTWRGAECVAPKRAGWVAEWFKAAVLKTAVGASSPWVRIPPHPPNAAARATFCDVAADGLRSAQF
jgi:hypothetical protein